MTLVALFKVSILKPVVIGEWSDEVLYEASEALDAELLAAILEAAAYEYLKGHSHEPLRELVAGVTIADCEQDGPAPFLTKLLPARQGQGGAVE